MVKIKFGAVLQACRERAGLSQEELAFRLNRSQSCVSRFEKDKKVPDIATFVQWMNVTQATEVAVAFLYGLDGVSILQNIMQLLGGFISWI